MEKKMSPVEMLKEDHKLVKGLFEKFKDTGDGAFQEQRKISEKIFSELKTHSQLEEEIFYPALRIADEEEYGQIVAESAEEHAVVSSLIEELEMLDPEDDAEQFQAKMKVMIENVEHHIDEEESGMLPHAEKTLGERSSEVAASMMELKQEIRSAPEEL
jgi:hemerythrin-like domain-containing protein